MLYKAKELRAVGWQIEEILRWVEGDTVESQELGFLKRSRERII